LGLFTTNDIYISDAQVHERAQEVGNMWLVDEGRKWDVGEEWRRKEDGNDMKETGRDQDVWHRLPDSH